MSRVKSPKKKKILAKKMNENRRMPIFVIARTSRKLTRNPLQRNWRRQKLKIKEK
ncbi:50S ribosomal protein L39e [Candidatus Micrarchaeota archaeon]|nr:50S ribosomal protein L39e [Candidatus Micrarchaeota archaeon]